MESIDPAVTELNRLARAAVLFRGDIDAYLTEIHRPMLSLIKDAPYLLRTDAMAGYIKQEYKLIVKVAPLLKEKEHDFNSLQHRR